MVTCYACTYDYCNALYIGRQSLIVDEQWKLLCLYDTEIFGYDIFNLFVRIL